MTTTVNLYQSTDASAPILTGTAGSLVALLDACLVNGYGTKAGAGWTIAYTGTNQRVYKMSPTLGTGNSLFVDDSATVSGSTPEEAYLTGFEAPTGLGTGTGQFPTSAQCALGIGAVTCRKSMTADTTPRPWTLVADQTCFYLFTVSGDYLNPFGPMGIVFGDLFSFKSSDAYRTLLIGRNVQNNGNNAFENFGGLPQNPGPWLLGGSSMAGHYMDRSWTGVGGSVPVSKFTLNFANNGGAVVNSGVGSGSSMYLNGNSQSSIGGGITTAGGLQMNYPNGPDGGLYLSPIWIGHNGSIRGYLKGLWAPLHNTPLNHHDTFAGTGNLAGKSFLAQNILGGTNNNCWTGQVMVETSSTWS
ncbi:MAG: hypothetical protein GJU73_06915 [Ferrovum sp.]|jgi:hypothetical protein|nr:hypothetical protein [Ferrovum sp.]